MNRQEAREAARKLAEQIGVTVWLIERGPRNAGNFDITGCEFNLLDVYEYHHAVAVVLPDGREFWQEGH